jgi:hypothetical protein
LILKQITDSQKALLEQTQNEFEAREREFAERVRELEMQIQVGSARRMRIHGW